MTKIAPPLAAALLAVAAAASAQTVYKWRDASGQLHVSDSPPPSDIPAKNILSRSGTPAAAPTASDAASAGAGGTDAELQKKKSKLEQEKAQAAALEKAKADQRQADARAANCAAAQQQARTLAAGGRITRLNANGEREFLDDATIASELRRAQDAVAQNCGPAPAQ